MASAHRVLYPEHHILNPPAPLPSYVIHTLTASDGISFDIWVLDHPSPQGRLLICHGYYADRYQVLGIADGLRQRGFEVLLFELRGHGSRRGPCTLGIKEREDAQIVLRWARRYREQPNIPLGVLGLSMGGALVCQVAVQAPEVRAIVVDSIYSRLFPIVQRIIRERYHLPSVPWAWLTWWGVQLALRARLSRRDPIVLAPRLHQPLLCIRGGQDTRVLPRLTQEFYQRWAGPKQEWYDPAVVHVGMFGRDPDRYCNRVASFFEQVFGGPAASSWPNIPTAPSPS